MIAFSCTHCSKPLRVKDELAGKKATCPACGQPVDIPASSPELAATASDAPKRSPVPGDAERTLPPRVSDAPDDSEANNPQAATHTGDASSSDTASGAPKGDHPAELTDFLALPQAADEIGRLGKYRVMAVLGRGGMGVVFKAQDPHLDRFVALKAMLPSLATSRSAKERFFREAKAAAALKHPHIVTIFDVGEDRGAPFLAMEFLEGEALDDRVKRDSRIPVPDILRIGKEVAEGLEAAHERGLIHRDIKPGNIWLEGKKGQVKILDFGLARAMADETHLTQSGAIVGTPAYMAPEQACGEKVDHRCDLFSLGCVLYRMCTGELPFKGSNTLAIISALALENPVPPLSLNPALPAELSDLVMKLLAKKREDRPADARAVAEALVAIMMHSTRPVIEAMPQTAVVPSANADDPFANIDDSGYENPKLPFTKSEPQLAASRTQFVSDVTVSPKKPRSRRLIFVGLAGALAIVAAFIVIKITNKNGPDTELQIADESKSVEKQKPKKELSIAVAPFDEKQAKVHQNRWAEQIGAPKHSVNSLGMKFVFIPPGKFVMGSSEKEVGRKPHEGPQHSVTLTRPFYLGMFEVTRSEYQTIAIDEPGQAATGARMPMVSVSWDEAVLFCKKLSQLPEERAAGRIYRLPTEAEWEYACRAGTTTAYSFGDSYIGTGTSFMNDGAQLPVGSLPANSFGLYDMHGNVYEWCSDRWDANYYANSPSKDPQGPDGNSTSRVMRGGAAQDHGPLACRSAHRHWNSSGYQWHTLGFRVVCEVADGAKWVNADGTVAVSPPSDEKEAKKQQEEWATKLKLPVEATSKLGMKMILIPPVGKALPKAYYLGKYEVTQGEWEKVMGYNPSAFGPTNAKVVGLDTSKFPVEQVSWYDSVEFCNKLSEKEGLQPYYDLKVTKRVGKDGKQIEDAQVKILGGSGYHIPTDAEWTHGCAAGSKTRYHFGDKDEQLPDYAWFVVNSDGPPHVVGEKKPNGFGLYDMHGNVREWNEEMLSNSATGAPERVSGGGDWHSPARYCAVNSRHRSGPADRNYAIGLRVARVAVGKEAPVVEPKQAADPDRRAAEYVLSIGGSVRVNDEERDRKAVDDLPREAFRLTKFNSGNKVSDAGLAHFKGCKNLTALWLGGAPVGDAGLAHFSDCKNLTSLDLKNTKVTNAGLANFKDCKDLTAVILYGTKVSDAGLANFKDCKNLTRLELYGTNVTDEGLAYFKDCKDLTGLDLFGTHVTDAGLAYFKDHKNLTRLQLGETQVTDTGLAYFKGCKNLLILNLANTQLSDAGLAHFKECYNLKDLSLEGTKAGDAGLANFKDCKDLVGLDLDGTNATDEGLTFFKGCKDLNRVNLNATRVTDTGLANFKICKKLTILRLAGTQVSDAGLAYFKDCKILTNLYLEKTKVTAAGIDDLAKALPKCKIVWDKGTVEPKQAANPAFRLAQWVVRNGGTIVTADGIAVASVENIPKDPLAIRGYQMRELMSQERFKEFIETLASLVTTGC